MMIKEITLSRGRKYSDNYQTTDYNVAITFEVNEYENAKEEIYGGFRSCPSDRVP